MDDGTTPNTFIVFHDYPTAPLIFEVRGLPSGADSKEMDKYRGVSIGVVVDCEGGTMVIPDYTSATIQDKDGTEIKKFSGSSSHFANFIDAVRSRKPGDLHADILEGHLSSALCHTGNISYRLGKTQFARRNPRGRQGQQGPGRVAGPHGRAPGRQQRGPEEDPGHAGRGAEDGPADGAVRGQPEGE